MTKEIRLKFPHPNVLQVVGIDINDLKDQEEIDLFEYGISSFCFLVEGLSDREATLAEFIGLIEAHYVHEIGTKIGEVVNFLKILDARIKDAPDQIPYLDRLKKEALEATTFRGHQMKPWDDYKDGKQSTAVCAICDKWVIVNTSPMPNGIDIGGSAVAMTCNGGEDDDRNCYECDKGTLDEFGACSTPGCENAVEEFEGVNDD